MKGSIATIGAVTAILASLTVVGKFGFFVYDRLGEIGDRQDASDAKQAVLESRLEALSTEIAELGGLDDALASRSQLRHIAEREDVQKLFSPFLTPGYSIDHCHRSDRKQPYSLTKLNRWGLQSLKHFVMVATSACGGRPTWVKPAKDSDAEWSEYEKRYNQFRKLAPVWVNMGLLQP